MPTKKNTTTKKRVRSTADETEEKIQFCQDLLLGSARPSEIKRKFRARWGKETHHSVITHYISRARTKICEEIYLGKDFHRAVLVDKCERILSNQKSRPMEVLAACDRLAKLLGLNAPTKIAPTDSAGNDLPPEKARAVLGDLYSKLSAGEKAKE